MRRVATVLLVALLAGCGGGAVPADPLAGVGAAVPRPENVVDPAPAPGPAAASACNPRASLRPSSEAAGPAFARIRQRDRLVVGVDQNAYLLSYRDPATGDLSGFEIDLARAIADAIFGEPGHVEFRAITTADRIPVLQQGRVDIVIRTMTMTCERWEQVSFSSEYLVTRQRLLVRTGSGIKSFADLGGRKVCATRGSTSIRTIVAQPSHPIPVSTESTLDCLLLLQQGQVDAVSTIDVLLAALAAQDPKSRVVGPPLSDEPAGVGVSKNEPELVRYINFVLERYRADGRWTNSYRRHLGRLGPVPPAPAPVYRQ
jgi:polar amino acid transport system substrate-binding protein